MAAFRKHGELRHFPPFTYYSVICIQIEARDCKLPFVFSPKEGAADPTRGAKPE